jgi:hypothetical protein
MIISRGFLIQGSKDSQTFGFEPKTGGFFFCFSSFKTLIRLVLRRTLVRLGILFSYPIQSNLFQHYIM